MATSVAGSLSRVWGRGQRIRGKGLPRGTYVVEVREDSRSLILSQAAQQDIIEARLYDADVHAICLETPA